ncbi:1-aminocyclopropane-1-carboxylate oxidase homolog 4 [Setaria italica]|uniref:Fe2OG dioxygenase domain-containing protein n=1 Tax=Setaria italica TaxID=4555 RepID=K4AL82_SETIT|nr:1-aminocyclopropane-1-carboxylate oxidase homolog 4 [Setaria italica]
MAAAHDYDAEAALARFHEFRAGVRGLVESGVAAAAVPPLFTTSTMPTPQAPATPSSSFTVPVVDLSLPRSDTVALVRAAARSRGFFHVTNHRVPAGIVASAIAAVRAFHEQPLAARSAFYSLHPVGSVAYSTIPITQQQQGVVDAPVLPWRDSLRVRFGPGEPELGNLPAWCRDALRVYQRLLKGFGEEMAWLLSEALGVGAGRLEQELRVRGWLMACHYYPPCPEPARVVGSLEHTDPGVFTVLVQDSVGGLQVRYHDGDGGGGDGGGVWVDVVPVAGALLVNIGDLLKVVSNDEFKSVEHRVVIKSKQDARVSIALFFNPAKRGDSDRFGPLPELVTAERPARYGNFTFFEFMSSRRKLGHSRSSIQRLKVTSN